MIARLSPSALRPVPEPYAGIYTHGTQLERVNHIVALSGQIGVAPDGSIADDFAAQCHQAMDYVEALLQEAGLDLADILRVNYYLTRATDLPELTEVRQARWRSETPPAVTTLVVAGLASDDLLIEIEVLAGR